VRNKISIDYKCKKIVRHGGGWFPDLHMPMDGENKDGSSN
jgi:hypothetical protein